MTPAKLLRNRSHELTDAKVLLINHNGQCFIYVIGEGHGIAQGCLFLNNLINLFRISSRSGESRRKLLILRIVSPSDSLGSASSRMEALGDVQGSRSRTRPLALSTTAGLSGGHRREPEVQTRSA